MPESSVSYLSDLYKALREPVAHAWPEVVRNGIWEADHAEMLPWEDFTPPYAVIAIDELPVASWGGTNDVYEPAVEIYYVSVVDGPLSPIRERLEALRDALNWWDQTRLQVVGVRDLTWSRNLLPNGVFMGGGKAYRAGRLTVDVLVGAGLPEPPTPAPWEPAP